MHFCQYLTVVTMGIAAGLSEHIALKDPRSP
jgi:hypothetical protein